MKKLLVIILIPLFWGCVGDSVTTVANTLDPDKCIDERRMKEIGEFVDSEFTIKSDLNNILEFNSISNNGEIIKVDIKEGINLYVSLLNAEKVTDYPIYKIKNSDKAILIVKGKGLWDVIWGKILIDRNTNIIERVEFDHKRETPGIGTKITGSKFENQFIGIKILFNKNTFGLIQDDKNVITGENEIDGVSGATFTSKGTIEMINEGILIYEKYLR